jgi:hypothetical protein
MLAIPWHSLLVWTVVGLLGGALGMAELVSRYRDAPALAVRNWSAALYILINVAASVGAFGLAKVFGWNINLGDAKNPAAAEWTLVLVCGLSAMALFRSSLFVRRIGDRDIGVGPSSFLQVFLNAADAEVDRRRAVVRASSINRIMQDVDYAKAFNALPPYSIALMQNLADDVQRDLRKALELLDKDPMAPELKTRVLGLELANVVGIPVLEQAVNSLGDKIQITPIPAAASPSKSVKP